MPATSRLSRYILLTLACMALPGCLATTVVKTTVGVAGQAAETTIKTAGAVGGAVIPNGSKKD